jgi:hypothetical protein
MRPQWPTIFFRNKTAAVTRVSGLLEACVYKQQQQQPEQQQQQQHRVSERTHYQSAVVADPLPTISTS